LSYAIVFTPEAQNDLLDLYEYIADRDGPGRALGYITRIEKTCMSLSSLPERGTARDDLRPGLRVIGFEHRVLIAFQVRSDSVAILRILYGGRSLELAFSQPLRTS
jgi:toxin ParE1/3/4